MRRKDREMSREFALNVVDKCEYAVISMIDIEGMPYCLPITIARDNDSVYFHCGPEGLKVASLRANPEICMTCIGDTQRATDKFTTEFESAILRGKAEEVIENTEKVHALKIICQRHTPANMDAFDEAIDKSLFRTSVWKIAIREITGKRKKYDKNGEEMKYGRME